MTGPDDVPTGNTYDKYATGNPVERRLVEGFMTALDASLPDRPVRRILEVGAGEGEVAGRLRRRWPDATLVTLDLPDETLAHEWGDWSGVFASAHDLPFADDSFDLVLAIEVLEHVPDPVAAVAEIRRVASADVVASVPREPLWRVLNMARGKYLRDLGNTPGHINHWGRRAFVELLGRDLSVTGVRSPLPWTMVAARSGH